MKSKRILIVLFICLLQTIRLFAYNETDTILKQKQCFYKAKTEIENMLSGNTPLDYERAVFITENAYWNNRVDYDLFKSIIDFQTNNIKRLAEANRNEKAQDFKQKYLEVVTEEQKKENYNKLLYNWAIYTFMTDTTFIIDSNFIYYHLPYEYSYTDPMATINWENSQVLKLLNTRKANCFALASLYKIFAERLNTDASLGLAPGHIYITHSDVKGITYNVELASHAFPGAGSIMTLTYSTVDAVQSGIAMRTLDLKQSVALCLVYLAKGYEHKFNTKTDNFLYQCAETTLQYDSLNLNAMLLKAEVLEENILNKKKSITQLQTDKQFKEYEKLIAKLYVQGYREMPLDQKNLLISQLNNDKANLIMKDHTPTGFTNKKLNDNRYATLSWGMFDEVQEPKLIEQYSRVLFNTKTKKIKKFVACDMLYNQYNFDPVVVAWQVDPMTSKMPNWSPYAAFGNNPIFFVDNEGKVFVTYISVKEKNESTGEIKKVDYKVIFNGTTTTMQQVQNGKTIGEIKNYKTGTDEFVDNIVTSYNYIVDNKADVDNAMKKMAEMPDEIEVKNSTREGEYANGTINYDFSRGTKINSKDGSVDGVQSPALGFWSEVYHGYIDKIDTKKKEEFKSDDKQHTQEEEYVHVDKEGQVIDALKKSNPKNNEAKRQTYGDGWKYVKTKDVTSTEKK